jgi:phosphoglycolate phosphatase
VLPENCYFVGDDVPDAQIAINAGVKGISELWGYRERKFLEQAGATVFINTPKELLDIIK